MGGKFINNLTILAILVLGFLVLNRCKNTDFTDKHEIKFETTQVKKIPIDSVSNFRTATLVVSEGLLFTDVRGRYNSNTINIYDWENGEKVKTINLPETGENSVGSVTGFWIEGKDTLVILGGRSKIVSLVNLDGEIIEKYTLDDKVFEGNGVPFGRTDIPPRIINNNLYFEIGPHYNYKTEDVVGKIAEFKYDLNKRESYPNFLIPDGVTLAFYYISKSRAFLNDGREIMVFPCCRKLFILQNSGILDTIELDIDWEEPNFNIVKDNFSLKREAQFYLENYSLDFILYDTFRDLLLCFVGIPTEIQDLSNGRWRNYDEKDFIIYAVSPRDFSIKGSIKIPAREYYPRNFILDSKGIWISNSTYLNPSLSEDEFSFTLFEY